jgi:hypothetical protein
MDQGRKVTAPYMSGMAGLAYNRAATGRDITKIDDLWDPAFKGKVSMLSDTQDGLGMVMLSQGNSPETPTTESVQKAIDLIREQKDKGQIRRFTGNDYADDLAAGNIAVAQAYSGDVVQLQADNPDLKFVVPEAGGTLGVQSMVIPYTTQSQKGVEAWIDYVYQPAEGDPRPRQTVAVAERRAGQGVQRRLRRSHGRLAQHHGRVAAAAVHGAEPRVDAQPGRQYPHPHHLVGRHRFRRELIALGSRLRQESHCGQGEYAPHGNADFGIAGTDGDDLLVQQRRRRAVRAAVLLGQRHPALREVENRTGGHVVEVDEPVVRWQCTSPRRVHREAGIDVTRTVHVGQRTGQRIGPGGEVGRAHSAADDTAGEHVESGCEPGDHQPARSFPQPDHAGVVETQRGVDEGAEVFSVYGVLEPQAAVALGSSIDSPVASLLPSGCHRW